MTEFKSTKTALLTSLILMLLCSAMLLGTTYAWFVDSVKSTDNRILLGNLDIDLLMDKSENGSYVSIADGSGDIFAESNGGHEVVWEPDKTEIVFLAVDNIGSLALKYDMSLSVAGELAGVLEYAVLEDTKAEELESRSWSAVKSRAGAETGNLKKGIIHIAENCALDEENKKDYYAIAVHMPDDAENSFQGDSLTVDLTIMATQTPYEEDSFGKDYDKDAKYEESDDSEMTVVTVGTIGDFKKFTKAVNENKEYDGVKVANNDEVYVRLTGDIDLADYDGFVGIGDENNSFDGVFDGCGHIIKNWSAEDRDEQLALFSTTNGGSFKNLIIENFKFGIIADRGDKYGFLIGEILDGDVVIEKVTVKKSTIVCQKTVGVLVGVMKQGSLKVTECKINNVTIENGYGYAGVAGVLLGDGYSEKCVTHSKNTVTELKWINAGVELDGIREFNYH